MFLDFSGGILRNIRRSKQGRRRVTDARARDMVAKGLVMLREVKATTATCSGRASPMRHREGLGGNLEQEYIGYYCKNSWDSNDDDGAFEKREPNVTFDGGGALGTRKPSATQGEGRRHPRGEVHGYYCKRPSDPGNGGGALGTRKPSATQGDGWRPPEVKFCPLDLGIRYRTEGVTDYLSRVVLQKKSFDPGNDGGALRTPMAKKSATLSRGHGGKSLAIKAKDSATFRSREREARRGNACNNPRAKVMFTSKSLGA
ncbi:hypothetical protein DFH06DRAFT_1123144 [Mycena polygramma]|nr:hypothetical protein DFH06DRAFT_1123144 [Mycena polygramma]